MDADQGSRRNRRSRVKKLLLSIALVGVSAMAALTVAVSQPVIQSEVVADPPSAPDTPSATPTLKAPHFGGWDGNWIGPGRFHGKGWPGP